MEGEHSFGDDTWGEDVETAFKIVHDLAQLDETTMPRDIASLIQRARAWRNRHVSSAD